MSYTLVEFKKDHSLMTIPSGWIFENKKYSHYPPSRKTKTQINKAIKEATTPSADWQKFRVKVHMEDTFENCEKKIIDLNGNPVSDSSSSELPEQAEMSSEMDISIIDESFESSTSGLDETLKNESAENIQTLIRNQKLILRELYSLRNQMTEMPSRECKCTSPSVQLSNKYQMPIGTIEDLKKLDEILNSNLEEKKMFMRTLVQVGGRNVQVCTYRILEKLLTADFSMQMNWCGKNPSKFPFTNVKNVVMCVVQSVCMTIKCKEHEVETYIKNYLRTAKDRLRIRNKQTKVRRSTLPYETENYEDLLKEISTSNNGNE